MHPFLSEPVQEDAKVKQDMTATLEVLHPVIAEEPEQEWHGMHNKSSLSRGKLKCRPDDNLCDLPEITDEVILGVLQNRFVGTNTCFVTCRGCSRGYMDLQLPEVPPPASKHVFKNVSHSDWELAPLTQGLRASTDTTPMLCTRTSEMS